MLSSAQLKEAFDSYDKDKSGALSFDEVNKLVQSLGAKSSKEDLEKMFKGIDTNSDGTLSFEEFLAWYRVGKSTILARTLRYQLELLNRSKRVAALAKSSHIPPPEYISVTAAEKSTELWKSTSWTTQPRNHRSLCTSKTTPRRTTCALPCKQQSRMRQRSRCSSL
jgi:hypothetical protein